MFRALAAMGTSPHDEGWEGYDQTPGRRPCNRS